MTWRCAGCVAEPYCEDEAVDTFEAVDWTLSLIRMPRTLQTVQAENITCGTMISVRGSALAAEWLHLG